ncbi:MAG: hypothetical protein ACE1ZE_02215, partial [Candidatus Binatia bacterium]
MILAIQMCEWNFDKAVGKEMTRVLREPQDPEGNRGAKAQRRPSSENKRFFKNITAEAQRSQRISFLFVGRRRQTKT